MYKSVFMKGMDKPRYPIVQGGMGVNISNLELMVACGQADILGTGSSVAIDQVVSSRTGKKHSTMEAVERQIVEAKECGYAAMNIMARLNDFTESVKGAARANANMIVSGAGFPSKLPSIVESVVGKEHDIALVPIVSSARAADIMIRKWEKQGYRPDAFVLEGPKAGGHIGWSYKDIDDDFFEKNDLMDVLLPELLDYIEKKHLDIPVIVAGGIRTSEDINYALSKGASAVQIGTPFVATYESGAIDDYKRVLVASSNEDVLTGDESWGSPAGLPFRYLRDSPLEKKGKYFCIGSALVSAAGFSEKPGKCPEGYLPKKCLAHGNAIYKAIYSAGTEIDMIREIKYAKDVVESLVK